MYVIKIKSCSNPNYWYSDKIGDCFFNIPDKCILGENSIGKQLKISEYLKMDVEYFYQGRINITLIKTVDLKDIKIYTLRYFKIKKMLENVSENIDK